MTDTQVLTAVIVSIGFLSNLIVVIYFFNKIEHRLTRLETTMEIILPHEKQRLGKYKDLQRTVPRLFERDR